MARGHISSSPMSVQVLYSSNSVLLTVEVTLFTSKPDLRPSVCPAIHILTVLLRLFLH